MSIALRLTGPRRARYAAWVTLHARVTPRLPVKLHGRSFVHGKLRVRVLGTSPWVAHAGNVASKPLHIVAVPKLVVRLVGAPIIGARRSGGGDPASGDRRADRRTEVRRHANGASRPRDRALAARRRLERRASHRADGDRRSLSSRSVPTAPACGNSSCSSRALHYAVEVDGVYGDDDVEAVYAFQKVEGLARTGAVTPALWAQLARAHVPPARYPGNHIEVDKSRQVLFVVRDGKVTVVVAVSTGATGNTPLGLWHVYRKVTGFDWVLYYPNYFLRGFAVHGYPDVPPYPASHGCVRIPMWVATQIYGDIALGAAIYVYL